MLSFVAATGHNNFTKSSYLYLQEMSDLANTHPDVYFNFSQHIDVSLPNMLTMSSKSMEKQLMSLMDMLGLQQRT